MEVETLITTIKRLQQEFGLQVVDAINIQHTDNTTTNPILGVHPVTTINVSMRPYGTMAAELGRPLMADEYPYYPHTFTATGVSPPQSDPVPTSE